MSCTLNDLTIRNAGPADAGTLAVLVAELASVEGKTTPPPGAARFRAWLADADPPFEALLAEHADAAVGYLLFYRAFSAFKGTPVMLVENVYVRPRARRLGAGRGLLAAAARLAVARGWDRMELNVRADNAAANGLYAGLGFHAPGEAVRRLEDAALHALAATAP